MFSTKTNIFFSVLLSFFAFFVASFASAESADIKFLNCSTGDCVAIENNTLSQNIQIGDSLPIQLVITNPEKAPIYSVQSWIKFNPTLFSVSNLSESNSAFALAAPGEFKVMNDTGEIRIGRAAMGEAISTDQIIIADFTLQVKKNPNGATLQFMDFIHNDIGKTAVVTIGNNIPANILNTQPKSLSFETLAAAPHVYTKPSNTPAASQTTVPGLQSVQNNFSVETNTGNNAEQNTQETSQNFIALPRPQGFRSRTYTNGKVENLWKMGEDNRVTGYYLYYSTTSGQYMHRRDIGKTNIYQFPSDFFDKGKRVYFAVQAYTANGEVSDFSDETYLVVGTEGSESHPFFEQIFPEAKITGQDESNTYYGADITDTENTTSGKTSSLPTPNISPQSGVSIPFHWFLLLGGIMMFFGGRLIFNRAG